MLKMTVTYLTPSGRKLTREKTVRSLAELEESIRIMKRTGYTPIEVVASPVKKV